MPSASLMRLASSAFSNRAARRQARRSAARGVVSVPGVWRPRRSIRAAMGQTHRADWR